MAMKPPDIDSHVSRANEIEAFAQFKASSPVLNVPYNIAELERDALICGPSGSGCEAFHGGLVLEQCRIRASLMAPDSLLAATSSDVADSSMLSPIPSMIAGPTEASERRPTILVVDDEPLYLELIADILRDDYRDSACG